MRLRRCCGRTWSSFKNAMPEYSPNELFEIRLAQEIARRVALVEKPWTPRQQAPESRKLGCYKPPAPGKATQHFPGQCVNSPKAKTPHSPPTVSAGSKEPQASKGTGKAGSLLGIVRRHLQIDSHLTVQQLYTLVQTLFPNENPRWLRNTVAKYRQGFFNPKVRASRRKPTAPHPDPLASCIHCHKAMPYCQCVK